MSIANVTLSDTFSQWVVKTNQLIAQSGETNGLVVFTSNTANLSFTQANAAFGQANTARLHANAAFVRANTSLANTGSYTLVIDNLTITGNLILSGPTAVLNML
jgi:hypothetical protein